jgi:hypothetical protein
MYEYTAVETVLYEATYRNEQVKTGHVKTINIIKKYSFPLCPNYRHQEAKFLRYP